MGKLTIKQKKFADEYIITGNAYKSAVNAGYSRNYAKGNIIRLLENVRVKAYIDQRLQELEDKAIAKQDEVLKYLTSIMRGSEREQAMIGIGQGEQKITSIDVSAKERLKAAELLGKRYALFTDKVDVEGELGLSLVIDYGEED